MCWIRSQDETKLIDAKEFRISANKLILWASSYDGIEITIGTFPKAAALEELNRIHDWIALQNAAGVYQVSKGE